MRYWVVNGTLRKGDWVEGAVEISEEQYRYYLDNYDLLFIEVVDGMVRSRVDIAAYRRAAIAKLENVNYIIVDHRKYFDDELPYLSDDYYLRSGGPCRLTKERMIKLVTERNRDYTMRRSGIQTAKTPEEVDGYLKCRTN
jgi:hypothetical protein